MFIMMAWHKAGVTYNPSALAVSKLNNGLVQDCGNSIVNALELP